MDDGYEIKGRMCGVGGANKYRGDGPGVRRT